MQKSGLTLAMIHNGELEHSPAATVRDQATILLGDMGWPVTLSEVSEQPPLPPIDHIPRGARRDLSAFAVSQRLLEHRFRAHLGTSSRERDAQASMGLIRDMYRLTQSADVAKRTRIRLIEQYVTQKHLQAARSFLEGPDPLALVLESDATWLGSTQEALRILLQSLSGLGVTGSGTYVNLAGGLRPEEIGLDETTTSTVSPGLVSFPRAASNTSCAYLMDRPLAEQLLQCAHEGHNEALGVDWLFNLLFMSRPAGVRVWHCRPPILGHGSITGSASSWHPDR